MSETVQRTGTQRRDWDRSAPPGSGPKPNFFDRTHLLGLAGLVLLAGIAMFTIYRTTSHGVGLRDDSFTYISSAEGISLGMGYGRVTGEGSFKPTTNFPPLYSYVLAAFHLAGLDLQAAARLVGGVTFAATVFLTGLIVLLATDSVLGALVASAVVLSSPGMIEAQTWALSEGTYISLSVLALILLSWSLTMTGKNLVLPLAGIVLALASLTRFVGVTLIFAAAAAFLLNRARPLRNRISQSICLAIGAALPLALFIVRSATETGSSTNRPAPFFHPFNANAMSQLDGALAQVLSPSTPVVHLPPGAVTIGVVALLIGAVFLAFRMPSSMHRPDLSHIDPAEMVKVAGLYGIIYLVFLLFAKTFLDRLIPFDSRLVSPLTPLIAIVVVGIMVLALARASRPLRITGSLLLVVWLFFVSLQGIAKYQTLSKEGLGFSSNAWKASAALAYVRKLPPETAIYTNDVPAVYLVGHHEASFVPAAFNPASLSARTDYADQLETYRQRLGAQGGYLIIIGTDPRERLPKPQFNDLTQGMVLVAEFGDGLVYSYP